MGDDAAPPIMSWAATLVGLAAIALLASSAIGRFSALYASHQPRFLTGGERSSSSWPGIILGALLVVAWGSIQAPPPWAQNPEGRHASPGLLWGGAALVVLGLGVWLVAYLTSLPSQEGGPFVPLWSKLGRVSPLLIPVMTVPMVVGLAYITDNLDLATSVVAAGLGSRFLAYVLARVATRRD